jgi:hypothetical protein
LVILNASRLVEQLLCVSGGKGKWNKLTISYKTKNTFTVKTQVFIGIYSNSYVFTQKNGNIDIPQTYMYIITIILFIVSKPR